MRHYHIPENLMRKLIAADQPDIKPDPAIVQRLQYQLLLKNSRHVVHQNSLLPYLGNLLLFKSMGMKAGLTAILLVGFLFVGKINDHPIGTGYSDSCSIHSLVVDSNYMIKDSCR